MAASERLLDTWQKFKFQSKLGLAQAILYLLSVLAAFLVCVPIGIVLVSMSEMLKVKCLNEMWENPFYLNLEVKRKKNHFAFFFFGRSD